MQNGVNANHIAEQPLVSQSRCIEQRTHSGGGGGRDVGTRLQMDCLKETWQLSIIPEEHFDTIVIFRITAFLEILLSL